MGGLAGERLMRGAAVRFANLSALQSRLVEAIRAGDWILAEDLVAQRFALMQALRLEQPLPEILAEDFAAIAAADREWLPQVEAALEDSARELHALKQAREAARKYSQ